MVRAFCGDKGIQPHTGVVVFASEIRGLYGISNPNEHFSVFLYFFPIILSA